jgi:hypothetical protein
MKATLPSREPIVENSYLSAVQSRPSDGLRVPVDDVVPSKMTTGTGGVLRAKTHRRRLYCAVIVDN